MISPLAQHNLFYRRPDLYDQVHGDDGDPTLADLLDALVADYAPDATSLLDLGCGTGRWLATLRDRYACTGIDIQPQMVAHARHVRPQLDIRVGDLRSFRLGHPVDLLVCIGSTLAYLHSNDDLQAAFTTFAAHAHPGTLLVVCTQIAPVLIDDPPPVRIDTPDLHATRTTSFEWDLATQRNTMHRHWYLDDGTHHHDSITWRVTGPKELELYATQAGFHLLETFTNPATRGRPLDGAATAWLVARHEGAPADPP